MRFLRHTGVCSIFATHQEHCVPLWNMCTLWSVLLLKKCMYNYEHFPYMYKERIVLNTFTHVHVAKFCKLQYSSNLYKVNMLITAFIPSIVPL